MYRLLLAVYALQGVHLVEAYRLYRHTDVRYISMDSALVRRFVRAITPPLVLRGFRSMLDRSAPEFEYVPDGFSRRVEGWNAEGVLETYSSKWPAFGRALDGTGPLAVNHEASLPSIEAADDAYAHNLLVSFAYVLALAAHKRDRISLLDWEAASGTTT